MKLSSYNIKCLVIYILYCLFFFFIGEGVFFDDDIKNYVFQYIAIPLIVYLLLPFVLKIIGHWRMVKWIDDVIDYLYRSIKEPGTQQLFHIERAELSADDSSKGNTHWLWKVAKILLWVAIIWGILILIYLIPGLGVPVAALAGYVGVKMTKKEVKK
jgi:hypothetical protein